MQPDATERVSLNPLEEPRSSNGLKLISEVAPKAAAVYLGRWSLVCPAVLWGSPSNKHLRLGIATLDNFTTQTKPGDILC